jgi:hypothetical protein
MRMAKRLTWAMADLTFPRRRPIAGPVGPGYCLSFNPRRQRGNGYVIVWPIMGEMTHDNIAEVLDQFKARILTIRDSL